MQKSRTGTGAAKFVSVILAIVFLWGAGVSLLGVLVSLAMGQSDETDYESAFLETVMREQYGVLGDYIQVYEQYQRNENSKLRETLLTEQLSTYARRFDPQKTNLRFTVTDSDGVKLLSNLPETESDPEWIAETVRSFSVTLSDKSYELHRHFALSSENLRSIAAEDFVQSLAEPSEYQLWYFTDSLIDEAYQNGLEVVHYNGQYSDILIFDTLAEAQSFDYWSVYGSFCDWTLVPESEREAAAASAHTPGSGFSSFGSADDTAAPDLTGKVLVRVTAYAAAETEMMSLETYLAQKESGAQLFPVNDNLRQALSGGLDVTVRAGHTENLRVVLHAALPAGLPAADRIRTNFAVYRLLFEYSEQIVIALFVCIVLTVIASIWMCSLAGYAKSGELSPSRVHSIAYECFWLLPVLIFVFSFLLMWNMAAAQNSYRILVFFGAGLSLCIAACCILWLYTTAVRVKNGTFWSSFFIFRAIRGFFGLFRSKLAVSAAVTAWLGMLLFLNALGFGERNRLLILPAFALDFLTLLAILYGIYAYFELHSHAARMEEGDFTPADHALPLYADFAGFDRSLTEITERVGEIVAKQTRAEHLRTELITNVSHDLKTPLTSIVNYVDLLSRQEMPTPEAAEYLEVLKRQAARLKKLTVDLVDASKASTGNLTVELMPTDVRVLIEQLSGEYEDRFAERQLTLIASLPDETVQILADGRQIWRVFDNLLGNACKYAMPGTRVYLDLTADAESVEIALKNVSATPLNISPDELMERFVRGDSSRHTEGSGLGLSIAKDLTALQNGTITLHTDGDLFKAVLHFARYVPPLSE